MLLCSVFSFSFRPFNWYCNRTFGELYCNETWHDMRRGMTSGVAWQSDCVKRRGWVHATRRPTYGEWVAACGAQRWADPSPACIAAIKTFTAETGTGGLAGSTYNIYDMCGSDDATDDVTDDVTAGGSRRADGAAGVYAALNDKRVAATVMSALAAPPTIGDHANNRGGLNNYPCGEAAGMTAWLNVPAVQKMLHVSVAHRPNGRWSPSTGLNFTHTEPTLLHMCVLSH
jgi:hypothetical protein